MFKTSLGFFESKISKNEGIILVHWIYNAPISMKLTTFSIQPTSSVNRYPQAQKKGIQVTQPVLTGMYNKYMEGMRGRGCCKVSN